MAAPPNSSLFPAFERYVNRTGLLTNAKGILAARLPRILGQGQTRAEGLDMPPATIERQQELLALSLPKGPPQDSQVQHEIVEARRAVAAHAEHMRHPENRRRFALQALHRLEGVPTGIKDNQFFAGRLILVSDKSGHYWAWSMTPHYPVIAKIPGDIEYIVSAYNASERIVVKWTLPVDRFLDRLSLAWTMAQHSTDGENVLIADVARLFKIAAQEERFWSNPLRRNFEDVPEAVFIANLINWRRHRDTAGSLKGFELVPATLNQAHGPRSQAFLRSGKCGGHHRASDDIYPPQDELRRRSNLEVAITPTLMRVGSLRSCSTLRLRPETTRTSSTSGPIISSTRSTRTISGASWATASAASNTWKETMGAARRSSSHSLAQRASERTMSSPRL